MVRAESHTHSTIKIRRIFLTQCMHTRNAHGKQRFELVIK